MTSVAPQYGVVPFSMSLGLVQSPKLQRKYRGNFKIFIQDAHTSKDMEFLDDYNKLKPNGRKPNATAFQVGFHTTFSRTVDGNTM